MLSKKNGLINSDYLYLYGFKIIVFILFYPILSGCNPVLKLTEKSMFTPTNNIFPGAPEPHGPVIKGTISGLPEGFLATISARLSSADSGGIIGLRGAGAWEMEVFYDENVQRKVIAQAEGYSVQPGEYAIYFKGGKAFLVQGGIKTDQEAMNLDFVFSTLSPTKTP